ncbi:MAG TPA: SIMPL domain-containing protein, partial [Solirubrobacteraceae bacterium]
AGSTAARSVGVEGVGTVPIGTADSAAQATSVYREGMAKALIDAQAKAAFLAEKSGVSLGAVVSLVEDGGYIECSGPEGREYGGYEGEQPDFGYGRSPIAAAPLSASAKGTAAPTVSHKPRAKKRRRSAHRASASRCNLTADVSALYALA